MKFEIDKEQKEKLNKWFDIHKTNCKYCKNPGAIGGIFSYMFTPNNIGESLKVECVCGEKIYLTDMDKW